MVAFCPVRAESKHAPAVVSTITIRTRDIFDLSDPLEKNKLFSLTNKLHITTRDSFIRKQLLFKEGDTFDPFILEESERKLREFQFIRKAKISSGQGKPGSHPVLIETHDAWTTIPELSYGTEGGKEFWSVGAKEKNLLGLGKTAAAFYKKEIDRTFKEFYYVDPAFFDPRWRFGLKYQKDGKKQSHWYTIDRPFYSTRAPWSLAAAKLHTRMPLKLYRDGDEIASWEHDREGYAFGGGISLFSTEVKVQRVSLSFLREKNRFTLESQARPVTLPEDRDLGVVRIHIEQTIQDYYYINYVNTFDRIEDLNLGNSLNIEYGYSPKELGSDRYRQLVFVSERKGWKIPHDGTLFFTLSGDGRFEEGKAVNLISFFHLYHYTKFTPRTVLVSSLNFEHGKNLDPENQLTLGGATGLRGYPIRQFTGNKKLIFNIEYRSFWVDEFLRLVSIGGILFFDTGFVWPEGRHVELENLRSNVGLGFRVDPTRGRGATPFNISIAYALNNNDHDSRWVLTISGKPDLLNSIGRPVQRNGSLLK